MFIIIIIQQIYNFFHLFNKIFLKLLNYLTDYLDNSIIFLTVQIINKQGLFMGSRVNFLTYN